MTACHPGMRGHGTSHRYSVRPRARQTAPRVLTALGLGAVIALGAGLGAVVGGGDNRQSGTPTPSGGVAATVTATTPDGRPDPVPAAVRRMSTERKVAQLFLWGVPGTGPLPPKVAGLAPRDLGGVVLGRGNYADPGQLRALTASIGAGKRLRPLVLAAQQGGEFNAFPGLPPATAPADLDDADQGALEARATTALRPLGVNGVLAPILDVGPPDGVAVGALAFSDRAPDVARYAELVTVGYRQAKVFAAAGHFPGLGSASQPVAEGPANVGLSEREIERDEAVPFDARDPGRASPGIVVSNGLYAYDDFVTPATLSRRVMTGLLRDKLGFQGVTLTSDLTDPAVTALERPPRAAVQALRAGADLLYISAPAADQAAAYRAVLAAVREKRVSAARLDEAVARVLGAKRDYGLLR